MTAVAYLGNRLDAAGYRLAGVAADCPPPGTESAALARALAAAQVVLLEAEFAEKLPAAELDAALARLSPLVAIVPQPGAPPCPLAPVERVRRQLGLEA